MRFKMRKQIYRYIILVLRHFFKAFFQGVLLFHHRLYSVGQRPHTSSMVRSLSVSFLPRARFAASPDSWERTFGTCRDLSRRLWSGSLGRCASMPVLSSFSSSTIRSSKRPGKRFLDAPGIKIMLKTWPMSLAISGSFCFVLQRLSVAPLGQTLPPQREKGLWTFSDED